MQKLLFLILCLFALNICKAQTQPVTTCGIYFDYDNAGNRIKRYYDCKVFDSNDPGTDPNPGGGTTSRKINTDSSKNDNDISAQTIQVYPNPANDYFIIKLSAAVPHTHFHFYDAKGSIIASGDMEEQEYRCNIGGISPGTYHLLVLYQGKQHSFKITKL